MLNTEKAFRESYLFSREEILQSLELFIEHEKNNDDDEFYSPAIRKNRIALCEKMYKTVKKAKIPVLSDPYWFYDYLLYDNRIELELCQATNLKVEDEMISTMTSTTERVLLSIESEYLSVERYAALLGVDAATVMQWIRRGRMRSAKKVGEDWMIPNTLDKPKRGFASVQYVVDEGATITSDVFPLLAAASDVTIYKDTKTKGKYVCHLRNDKDGCQRVIELS